MRHGYDYIADFLTHNAPYENVFFRRPHANERTIDKACEMIQQAKMPLILIGAGANRNRTSGALKKLIDK